MDPVTIQLRTGADADARRIAAAQAGPEPPRCETDTLGEGGAVTVTLTPERIKERQDFAIQQNITTLRNRVDELGVTEPIVARQGVDRIVVQLPGVQDPNEALRVLGATATLEFRLVDDQNDAAEAERTKRAPLGSRLYHTRDNQPVLLKRDIIASGRAARGCELRLPGGPARRVRQARRARRRRDARRRRARTSAGRWRSCSSRRSASRRTSRATACAPEPSAPRKQVISVATIRGVFSSNFQITGLLAGEAQGARAAAARRLAGGAALHRRAAHGRPEPRPGQHRPRRARAARSACSRMFVFMVVYYRLFGMSRPTSCCSSNMVLLDGAAVDAAGHRCRCRASRVSCSPSAWPWTPTS